MHFHRTSDGIVSHRLAMSLREDSPYNAGTTYLDETTRSGQLKHVKESGAAHRETVPLEGGRTSQNLVRYQRTRGNCRGGDKKGFSDRGGYGCRYRAGHHRDHQCLVASFLGVLAGRVLFQRTQCSVSLGPSKTWIKVKNPKAPAAARAFDGTFEPVGQKIIIPCHPTVARRRRSLGLSIG